jgi:hypothetical protein
MARSGAGSISHRDPYQNVTDPQPWLRFTQIMDLKPTFVDQNIMKFKHCFLSGKMTSTQHV